MDHAQELDLDIWRRHTMEHCFDIRDYGAQPDPRTINTKAIQKAITACHDAGGGRVVCPSGSFMTGSLELRSNVELHLMAGCRLVGSTSLDDYVAFQADGFRGERAAEGSTQSLLRASDAENVAITGPGEIDGSGLAFYDTGEIGARFFKKPSTPRPRLVMFYRCRNIRFVDASFLDSPCWTFWLMKCERVFIHRVRIAGDQRMINNDGIDLDSCRDVTVSDCIIKTSDDCLILRAVQQVYDAPGVCENITVSNCVLDSWCQGIRIGCPGDNSIRNASFSNLTITSATNGILIENPTRYLPKDSQGSADVHDLMFSDVVVNCQRWPIKIAVDEGIALKRLSDLSFSNFRIHSGGPCLVSGSTETIIRNVSFSNIRIATTGEDAVVCRHCEGIRLNDVELSNVPDPSGE